MEQFETEQLESLLNIVEKAYTEQEACNNTVLTNWIVFTGTYSAGKTTLIKDISEKLKFPYQEEPARVFIETKLQSGLSITELWANVATTVIPIHKLRVDSELSLKPSNIVLLDTAIPDTIPYALLYGVDPHEIIKACFTHRYQKNVFLIEPLPLQLDRIRNKNNQERIALHYLRKRIYMILGYNIVSVPILDRASRSEFVIKYLNKNSEIM